MYRRLNGTDHTNYHNFGSSMATFVLNDGTLISFWSGGSCSATNKTCGFIYTDINGKYPPNQWGRDMFGFILSPTNIVPFGVEGYEYTFQEACNKSRNSYLNGLGCTAWVIYNENMEYLRCNDLDWGKKNKMQINYFVTIAKTSASLPDLLFLNLISFFVSSGVNSDFW